MVTERKKYSNPLELPYGSASLLDHSISKKEREQKLRQSPWIPGVMD
jgi:hypothetical protein